MAAFWQRWALSFSSKPLPSPFWQMGRGVRKLLLIHIRIHIPRSFFILNNVFSRRSVSKKFNDSFFGVKDILSCQPLFWFIIKKPPTVSTDRLLVRLENRQYSFLGLDITSTAFFLVYGVTRCKSRSDKQDEDDDKALCMVFQPLLKMRWQCHVGQKWPGINGFWQFLGLGNYHLIGSW